jgi:hypothetical protein
LDRVKQHGGDVAEAEFGGLAKLGFHGRRDEARDQSARGHYLWHFSFNKNY